VFVVDANLDCESQWSGLPLSHAVRSRISLYGALISALAPDGDIELWTPAGIDPARWLGRPIAFRSGTPGRADLRWADPSAKPANDRRLAHQVAGTIGAGLPGAWSISLDGTPSRGERRDQRQGEVSACSATLRSALVENPAKAARAPARTQGPEEHLKETIAASFAASHSVQSAWIAKVPWTAAGRDRVRGEGPPTDQQLTRLSRLLAACGALVVEPYCDRIFDFGVCATVDHLGVDLQPPHSLLVDSRGGFVGIDLAEPPLEPAERELVDRAVEAAGNAIAATGYHGPFAVDGFAYRDGDQRRIHPLCEINARYSFGWIARAFGKRLGFGPPPSGATTLIAPAADGVTAWIA
jgi:hypothetical protein